MEAGNGEKSSGGIGGNGAGKARQPMIFPARDATFCLAYAPHSVFTYELSTLFLLYHTHVFCTECMIK